MLLDRLPNVYTYSLTGDNLGYTFLKIRGFDQSRVGVMINDIPLNDPEDQQVYWVDHPDLAESVQPDLAARLIENALEDCVSAFDGFGRELCRVYAAKAAEPAKVEKASFQNVESLTRKKWMSMFILRKQKCASVILIRSCPSFSECCGNPYSLTHLFNR